MLASLRVAVNSGGTTGRANATPPLRYDVVVDS